MGYNISAYVERKNKDTGEWELVDSKPVSSCLKYVFDDYQDFPRLDWENLSKGLKEKYKKERLEDGKEICYASFYVKTPLELEDAVGDKIRDTFTRLNVVVKALGCSRVYNEDGDEVEPWGDDDKEKLTFPINKQLVDDLQYGYETMRNIGQREAFDLILSEFVDYGDEVRVVFVVS